jgi:hypothetical protein
MKVYGNLNFVLTVPIEVANLHVDYANKIKEMRRKFYGSEKND